MLLTLYVTAGLIGRHRLLFRLTFDRDSADGDNLALRHWLLLLFRLLPCSRLVSRRLVVRLLFDRSCGRSLLLLPLRLLLAHEWFQSDLLIDISLQTSFLYEGIFFQTGHPLCRSFVSYDEALRTGLWGSIAIGKVLTLCYLDVSHDGASRGLLFLLLDLQVLPQRGLTRWLIMALSRCLIVFISLDEILADASLTNSYCTLHLLCCQWLAATFVSRAVELLTTHEAFRSA